MFKYLRRILFKYLDKLILKWDSHRAKLERGPLDSKEKLSSYLASRDKEWGLPHHRGLCMGEFKDISYFMGVDSQKLIDGVIIQHGAWELETLMMLDAALVARPGAAFVEVGSNIGAIAIPLALRHPGSPFVCIDPHPAMCQQLKDNAAFNNISNIELVQKAVTAQGGQYLDFYAESESSTNPGLSSLVPTALRESAEAIKVETINFDDFYEASARGPVGVIKIDVQGVELSVLEACARTIARHRPVVLFEFEGFHYPDMAAAETNFRAILEFFEARQYRLFSHDGTLGTRFLTEVKLNPHLTTNILAMPQAR